MQAGTAVRKGVILAVDSGMKLRPITSAINKCLIPIFDKPMLFYPLSALLLAGVQQVLIVASPEAIPEIERVLGSGGPLGISIVYVPHAPNRPVISTLCKLRSFFESSHVVFTKSNCLPFGSPFELALLNAGANAGGATIFAKRMRSGRHAYGVVIDDCGEPVELCAAGIPSRSCLAVAELAVYDHKLGDALDSIAGKQPCEEPLVHITRWYLDSSELRVSILDNNATWYQIEHFDDVMCASVYVEMLQAERDHLVGSPEEAAHRRGLLNARQLLTLSDRMPNSYGHRLRKVALRNMPLRYDP